MIDRGIKDADRLLDVETNVTKEDSINFHGIGMYREWLTLKYKDTIIAKVFGFCLNGEDEEWNYTLKECESEWKHLVREYYNID